MRIARKLFLLAAMAIAALALSATTASAQIQVFDEPGDACSTVLLEHEGHVVHGGCHWEIQSTHHISLVVQTAGGPVTLMNCLWHLEGRINGQGGGFITLATLTSEPEPTNPGCTRKQCDEGNNGTDKPWPFEIFEQGFGNEDMALFLCLETLPDSSPTETSCELHLPLIANADHEYMLGAEAAYSCENLPPVSFQNVELIGESNSEEDVEIIH